jgi:hypothetical protein
MGGGYRVSRQTHTHTVAAAAAAAAAGLSASTHRPGVTATLL